VADTKALRAWVADAVGQLGGLDVFVANVSAFGMAMDEDTWRRSFEIDVMGTVAGVEAAIPHLEKSRAGAIVVVGTTGALEMYGAGYVRPYAAVKAALVPYVKGIARSLAPKDVRANLVSPGNIYFKGGVWNTVEERNPETFKMMLSLNQNDAVAEPNGPYGHARRGRQRGSLSRQPTGRLYYRHQLDHRRCPDPARTVLTVHYKIRGSGRTRYIRSFAKAGIRGDHTAACPRPPFRGGDNFFS